MKEQEHIVGVGIKYKDVLYKLPRPNRHMHVNQVIQDATGDSYSKIDNACAKGFYTNEDRFLSRGEAALVAFEAKQIDSIPFCLISDYLWSDDEK